jgi:hypothetical protein
MDIKIRQKYVDRYGDHATKIVDFELWLEEKLHTGYLEEKVDRVSEVVGKLICKLVEVNVLRVGEVFDIMQDDTVEEINIDGR